ncbi:MarR family winged helix-turn-helix transcriptional regulator [Novosphingobium gossypii]|uniref:MarR family winged helix-turn-helix transcriptional regulator n=1 Tax=Novosphingobium gossypii TaxID=1604774 RepID=UPI003D2573B4
MTTTTGEPTTRTAQIGNTLDVGHETPTRQVSLLLATVSRLQRTIFDRSVASLGVTRAQWAMIAVVARHPGASQRTLAEHLETSEAAVGRLIERLCTEGLLERRERNGDRRTRAVYLTEQARPLLDRLGTIAVDSESTMLAGFSKAEIDALLGFMARMHDNVTARGEG